MKLVPMQVSLKGLQRAICKALLLCTGDSYPQTEPKASTLCQTFVKKSQVDTQELRLAQITVVSSVCAAAQATCRWR